MSILVYEQTTASILLTYHSKRMFAFSVLTRAGLWHSHCRKMPMVYDVKGFKRLQKMAAKYSEHTLAN